jgi:hypothetical protein
MGTDLLKARAHDVMRKFWAIAFAAQVAQIKMAETGGHDLLGRSRGVFIGKMPVPAEDALFEAPRPADGFLQHFDVVIAFKDQRIGGTNALDDKPGDVTKVGREADISIVRAKQEAHGILGVMRDAECLHGDVADLEGGAGRKKAALKLGVVLVFNCFQRCAVAVKRDSQFIGQAGQPTDMVGMFVCNEDAMQTFGRAANGGQPLSDLPHAETGVNEDAGFFGFQIGAVAAGAAPQNCQLHTHAATLVAVPRGGNLYPSWPFLMNQGGGYLRVNS